MITRNDVLCEAVDKCIKEVYSKVQPSVTWEEFMQQNKDWKEGEPYPYEFYYLPKQVFKDLVEYYIYAYRIGSELEPTIDCLINYFKDPVRDKYIERNGDKPGYRSYEHFDSLPKVIGEEAFNKVIDYFNEAKNFYNWNRELNSFNISVYLGCSPDSNKEAVIENWKKYRNKDIIIDDSYWKEFYDDEEEC